MRDEKELSEILGSGLTVESEEGRRIAVSKKVFSLKIKEKSLSKDISFSADYFIPNNKGKFTTSGLESLEDLCNSYCLTSADSIHLPRLGDVPSGFSLTIYLDRENKKDADLKTDFLIHPAEYDSEAVIDGLREIFLLAGEAVTLVACRFDGDEPDCWISLDGFRPPCDVSISHDTFPFEVGIVSTQEKALFVSNDTINDCKLSFNLETTGNCFYSFEGIFQISCKDSLSKNGATLRRILSTQESLTLYQDTLETSVKTQGTSGTVSFLPAYKNKEISPAPIDNSMVASIPMTGKVNVTVNNQYGEKAIYYIKAKIYRHESPQHDQRKGTGSLNFVNFDNAVPLTSTLFYVKKALFDE